MYILALLLDVLPPVDHVGHLARGLVVILVLPLQMLPDIRGAYAILALAANDNPQASDLFK
jgi:hypothetical protein